MSKKEVAVKESELMPVDMAVDYPREETLADLMNAENNKNEVFSTIEDELEVYNTMNGEATSLKDAVNEKLKVTNLMIHKSEATDIETGEVFNGYRMLFITDKGVFSTSSKSVFNNVRQLNALRGIPTEENPWFITPKMKKGRRYDYLILTLSKD